MLHIVQKDHESYEIFQHNVIQFRIHCAGLKVSLLSAIGFPVQNDNENFNNVYTAVFSFLQNITKTSPGASFWKTLIDFIMRTGPRSWKRKRA